MNLAAGPSVQTAIRAAGLDPRRMPRHVAIIMDGNGRWARARGLMRHRGHQTGADAVRAVTTQSVALGLERLTLYAFSSENWQRPAREVTVLMRLLEEYLRRELPTLIEHEIRLQAIGRLERLPDGAREVLDDCITQTAQHRRMTLCLALSYGGRDELVDACRSLAAAVAAERLHPDDITAADLQAALYAPEASDVDVVIRSAGESRLSNFLPWQTAYAEFVSAAALWPDFGIEDYHAALREYQSRDRRFGRVD